MSQNIAKTAKGPIEYRFEGSGPTVLVLNGSHCSRESRLSHERLTEHGFSVLTPSRPGYDSTRLKWVEPHRKRLTLWPPCWIHFKYPWWM
jgi:hypothetical protein